MGVFVSTTVSLELKTAKAAEIPSSYDMRWEIGDNDLLNDGKAISFNVDSNNIIPSEVINNIVNDGTININKNGEKGTIAVKVKYLNKNGNKVKLQFIVQDTGIGISKENLSKVFESFTQADSSTTRKSFFPAASISRATSEKVIPEAPTFT